MLAATYSTSGTFPVGGFLFLLLPLLVLGVIALAGLFRVSDVVGEPHIELNTVFGYHF